MLLDIDYILLGMPGIVVSVWAQWRIASACSTAAKVQSTSGLTGAEAARRVLDVSGIAGIPIVPASGQLANHYDPSRQMLRLSQRVYEGRSLSALGIAAHEAGHALQHASRFPWLMVRNAVVPLANLGSIAFWMLIGAGLLLGMFRLIVWGLALFSVFVLLELISLPIELDANRRVRQVLVAEHLTTPEEEPFIGRMLNAAAWTYVAEVFRGVASPLWSLWENRDLSKRREQQEPGL